MSYSFGSLGTLHSKDTTAAASHKNAIYEIPLCNDRVTSSFCKYSTKKLITFFQVEHYQIYLCKQMFSLLLQ